MSAGRLDATLEHFRRISVPLFIRHGFRWHGPWIRDLDRGHQIVYVVEFESEKDRDARWHALRTDAQWVAHRERSANASPDIAAISVEVLASAEDRLPSSAPNPAGARPIE